MKSDRPLLVIDTTNPFNSNDYQFTREGLEVLIEYYNQKYPERGEIRQILITTTFSIKENDDYMEYREEKDSILDRIMAIEHLGRKSGGLSDEQKILIDDLHKQRNLIYAKMLRCVVDQNAEQLQLKDSQGEIQKVIITVAREAQTEEDEIVVILEHSNAFLFIPDKALILLRDEPYENEYKAIYKAIADKLNVQFIDQKIDDKKLSMQASHTDCHGIACAILKDLTKQDIQDFTSSENHYRPLPKMLKYAQSTKYTKEVLPGDLLEVPVKSSGVKVLDYIESGKQGDKKDVSSRIATKTKRFFGQLITNSNNGMLDSSCTPKALATKILESQRLSKQEQKRL